MLINDYIYYDICIELSQVVFRSVRSSLECLVDCLSLYLKDTSICQGPLKAHFSLFKIPSIQLNNIQYKAIYNYWFSSEGSK